MQDREVIDLLWKYGHFRNPAYENGPSRSVSEDDLATLTLGDAAVKEALKSYQHFQKPVLDDLSSAIHGRRAIADGDPGPATEMLLQMPRCGAADYALTDEALGSGRWGQCAIDQYPDNHALVVSWDLSRIPAFLKPVFEQVWRNVVTAYAEIGIAFIRRDGDPKAHISASFTVPQQEGGGRGGNWIGLAIVGWSGIRCSDQIWAMFDLNYQPQNIVSEWTTLVKHELGHNMGLQHSSGGVMNPSIIRGLPISWKGDPSHSTLARWFGGEPVILKDGPVPPPVPPTQGDGRIPDFEITYKGRTYLAVPKAEV